MSNKEDLLRKLKALASQGVQGEKFNAQAMLDKLMKKYNIDPQSLDDDILNWVEIKVKKGDWQKELLTHVILSCLPTYKRSNSFSRNTMKIDLTKAEEVEVRAKYEYYSKRMSEDISILFSAFLCKNNLFFRYGDIPNDDEKPVDKERVKKIVKMMNGMDTHTYYKQLKEVQS